MLSKNENKVKDCLVFSEIVRHIRLSLDFSHVNQIKFIQQSSINSFYELTIHFIHFALLLLLIVHLAISMFRGHFFVPFFLHSFCFSSSYDSMVINFIFSAWAMCDLFYEWNMRYFHSTSKWRRKKGRKKKPPVVEVIIFTGWLVTSSFGMIATNLIKYCM